MTEFIGRRDELKLLGELLTKRIASLVVVRGRRRIGKSRLIREFGKSIPSHIFSGIPPTKDMTKQSQIDAFCRQIERAFGAPKFSVEDWGAVFWHLGKLCANSRVMIALDEISWIGSKDPNFLGELKNAWDLYFSHNPELILVLCGSVSSWIEKNILSSTGFLGRISMSLKLEELPLCDAIKFWSSVNDRISVHEILSTLGVTGGIPRYLEEIQPNLSTDENIRRLCFRKSGLLFQEFDKIFSDLFSSKAPMYASLTKFLADGPRTVNELCEFMQKSDTTISEHVKDLVQAGFVAEDPTWNLKAMKISNLKRYRLSDNYLRFYLKFILPNKHSISQKAFEQISLGALRGWDSAMGLQFENLVLNNVHPLLEIMGLQLSDLVRFGPFFQRPTKRIKGCQVDLLIEMRFRTVFLCEVKFTAKPVGMEVVRQMRDKQDRIHLPKGWSTRLVLIHVNGVSREVMQSGAFDHIIDFSTVLEL